MAGHVDITGPLYHSPRVNSATINKIIKKVVEPLFRNYQILNRLRKAGRITFNHKGGPGFQWTVDKRINEPQPYSDMQPVPKQRTNYTFNVGLPWRAFIVGESVSKDEKLSIGNGPETLVNVLSRIIPKLTQSMTEYLSRQIWLDGNANATNLHGIESWMSDSGSNFGSKMLTPNDTYAGASTAFGDQGGSWTGTFPEGNGSYEYTCFSPLIWDYTHANWSATGTAWKDTWREAMSTAITYMMNLHGKKIDLFTTTAGMYLEAETSLEGKEQILVSKDESGVGLGYRSIFVHGVEVTYEYNHPADAAYGHIFSNYELMSRQGQLFEKSEEDDFDLMAQNFALDFHGNFRCQTPAWSVKLWDDAK